MAQVYIPAEIQENIFSYLMYSSAKGLAFKWNIQEAWFKVNFTKLQRALSTRSRETYHRELVRMLLDIDELPNLTYEMRTKFHTAIYDLHKRKIFTLTSTKLWRITWSFYRDLGFEPILHHGLKDHFMVGYISAEGSTYHGYVLLDREMNRCQVNNLLGRPHLLCLRMLGITKSTFHIRPASELCLNWRLFDNIKHEDGVMVSFGNWKLFETQADNQVTLQYPTSYSRYLLGYTS